jgi:hypothetical protein
MGILDKNIGNKFKRKCGWNSTMKLSQKIDKKKDENEEEIQIQEQEEIDDATDPKKKNRSMVL